MAIANKFPGKDISIEDIKTKFPLVAKKNKQHKSKFTVSGVEFGSKLIPVFAGPNMVESEKLILNCAKNVKKAGAHFLRGGAFKPLTFPYRSSKYYETREDGIKWLKKARDKFEIPIITEIMEERYLDIICKSADILQIGSRNMQNLELLREASKTKKPIILKRHFGSSLRDLLGAAEHILVEGNFKLILCERGVSIPHTHKSTSRFALDLQAIPALKELTSFPIISDPSHASFWSPWVPSLTYASIAAGCDGLIIEMHPNPSKSKVDPLQPLNYKKFKDVIKQSRKICKIFKRKII